MAFWWVNHKQTYKEEIEGGYIWSPKTNKDKSKNQTYLNLSRTRINDTIFSYANGKLRAIGRISHKCQDSDRPSAFGKTGEQWDRDGWLVQVEWSAINKPLSPKANISDIAPLLPKKYSPIQPGGNGNQKCYLAEISNSLATLLLKLTSSENEEMPDVLDDLGDIILEDAEEDRIVGEDLLKTEKEQLVKARRGQGVFKIRVERVEKECRLTGVQDKRLLIASHIKPWRSSDNREKLDGNNGLLLSPHVDKLFDRGWISFTDDGRILCADITIVRIMEQWGLNPNKHIGEFNKKQTEYLAFHREYIHKPRTKS